MALNESRFINRGKQEQVPVDEDLSKANPIVEAVFKPRWNVPLLSKYTSAVGRAAKKVDKSIEEKVGTSKVVNLGTLLGQYSLSGKMVSPGDIMSTVTPFIGDVETGKYSLFDIALGGTEVLGSGVGAKSLREASKLRKSLKAGEKIHKQNTDEFLRNIVSQNMMGGDMTLKESKKWTKEWAVHPETYIRNMGARAEGAGVTTQLYKRPSNQEMAKKVAKKLGIKQPPSVLEFQNEQVKKMIKEGIIKEETINAARWNIDNLGTDEIEKLRLIYPGAKDRLSDAAYLSKYEKEMEAIGKGIQDETMQYIIGGKTKKETDLFVQMAQDPKTTAKDMADFGFEKEYKGYLKYKKDIEERMGKIKRGHWEHFVRGVEAPDMPYREGLKQDTDINIMGFADRMKLARKPQYGFMDVGPGAAGYWRPQTIVADYDANLMSRTRVPGVYREKVVIDAGVLNQDELASVAVHEFQHYLTKGTEGIPRVVKSELIDLLKGRGDFDKLIDFWKKNDLRVRKLDGTPTVASKASDDEIGLTIQYFVNTTELQARMQQVRKALKTSPGKKVSTKQVDELLSSSDEMTRNAIQDLLNVMKDKKSLLKALNTLPALVPATFEENLFNEWDREDNIF